MKLLFLPAVCILALIAACNKSQEPIPPTTTIDDAMDRYLFNLQDRTGVGPFGCFELLFPVNLSFSDGTTPEVDSYNAMKQTMRTYFTATTTGFGDVSLVFPITLIAEDGQLIEVHNDDQLRALRSSCGGATFDHYESVGHSNRRLSCFELVFPITIQLPDGTTATADDRAALQTLIRENATTIARPRFVFPITVKMTEDGSLVTVNSQDELRALKAGCE